MTEKTKAQEALDAFNAFMAKEGRQQLYKCDAILATHSETIRTALQQAEKVEGLIELLEKINQYTNPVMVDAVEEHSVFVHAMKNIHADTTKAIAAFMEGK